MNQITDLPDNTTAGLNFNYLVWTPNTDALLCSVPWNNDYRDIVKFDSQSATDVYLESNAGAHIVFNQMTFARPGAPVRIALPYDQCYAYNYLRVRNNALPVSLGGGKTFYYFILDIKYVAPNTTELVLQLDVWQSFGRDVTFGNCYVERGHIGLANENNVIEHGRQTMVVPEGMDLGNEYQITHNYEVQLSNSDPSDAEHMYDIIVYSTTQLDTDWGTTANPILTTATGSSFEGAPSAMSVYMFDSYDSFKVVLGGLSDHPWIGQGIVSVTAVPPLSSFFNMTFDANGYNSDFTLKYVSTVPMGGAGHFYRILGGRVPQRTFQVADAEWRNRVMAYINDIFPGKYGALTKFLTYPYSMIELTCYTGTPLILKPECVYGEAIDVIQSSHFAQPSPRIMFTPLRYNATNTSHQNEDMNNTFKSDGGEYLDMSTGITNFPTYPVVNNSYLAYISSNKNSIAYQHNSADWSQQRALAGADAEQSNARQAIIAGGNAVNSQIQQNNSTAGLDYDTQTSQGVLGMVNGLGGGLASMGTGNLIGGGIHAVLGVNSAGANMAINQNKINQQNEINNQGMFQRWNASKNQMNNVLDTNLSYAQYSAKGDYQNAIAGINAKVQDAKMIQPTTAGQLGGDAFLLSTFNWGVNAKVKLVNRNVIQQIGDFWLRYGYAVNRFMNMQDSGMTFKAMTKFTYWKMRETYIISSGVPEGFRQTIRGIFEKGVTIWSNPNEVGRVSIYENKPIEGISI